MWVRTTLTTERWTTENTEDDADIWDASSWGEFKDPDRCCWKHKQCTGHIIYPFASAYGHHDLHLHSVNHCDCDSRLKDCSEKTNSSSFRDVGSTCSRDVGSTCFNIIQSPCLELIPEELCVERFWYGWCKSYRPVSVAVIHYPIHHECGADDLNEEEEEEEEEESTPPIPTQVGPTTTPTDTGIGTVTGTPDSAAPITIWRSESPTGKSQGSKVIKKVKKKKEKEQEEESDEKAQLKKKAKKGKLSKKKSQVKSESSPPDVSRSLSPRELVRMSESSPDSREDLESEDSYNDPRQEEPSSEDIVASSLPRKREKNTVQAKKPRAKASPVKKVTKRKSPPASNPNLS